jgi:transposase
MARWAQKHRDALVLEERRLKALGFLRQGVPPAEVARRLAVTPQAVHQWKETLQANGPHALRAKPREGRHPFVERETMTTLPEILARGAQSFGYQTDLWTLGRIVDVLEKEWGVRYTKSGVWVMLKRNGFSWQRPSRRAREKDPAKVAYWTRYTWPRLKKKPVNDGR